jgi:hypothetical protein
MRQGRVQTDNLLDPDDWLVIMASTSSQTAVDAKFNGKISRGALSYFLDSSLRWLRDVGTQITGETLFRHLAATFHAKYPRQTPLRHGNIDICFFAGLINGPRQRYTSVFQVKESGGIVLEAGEAQGVAVGDEYRAYPFYSSEARHNAEQGSPVTLRVLRVDGLNSEVSIVPSLSSIDRLSGLYTWKAELSLSSSKQKIGVYLDDSLLHDAQDALRLELASYPFMQLVSGHLASVPCVFRLQVNDESDYEILDSAHDNGFVNPVPTIRCESEGALESVAVTLRHLTAFKFFESLQNRCPNSAFTSTFKLEVLTHTTAPDGFFNVVHEDTWTLKISNTSSKSIYLTVFEFQQSWEVSNLVSDAIGADHLEIGPGASEELPIDMAVPDDLTQIGQSIDIVKIFITSKTTHFPSAVLPKLGEGLLRDDGPYAYLLKWIDGFTSMRAGSENGWMTQNFPIRTCTKKSN